VNASNQTQRLPVVEAQLGRDGGPKALGLGLGNIGGGLEAESLFSHG